MIFIGRKNISFFSFALLSSVKLTVQYNSISEGKKWYEFQNSVNHDCLRNAVRMSCFADIFSKNIFDGIRDGTNSSHQKWWVPTYTSHDSILKYMHYSAFCPQ